MDKDMWMLGRMIIVYIFGKKSVVVKKGMVR